MKKHILSLGLFLATAFALSFNSCNTTPQPAEVRVDTVIVVQNPPVAETATYFETPSDKKVVIANPIICQFNVKNYNPDDDWSEACFAHTNTDALAACIFQAVIKGRLKAYDFRTEQPLSVAEVKKIDKERPRGTIGQIQFEEEWFFDEKECRLYKKVNALTWGYEKQKGTNEYGFVAAFRVVFPEQAK